MSLLQLQIPIFPLPNVVFFPGTLLPLHIFEPRYRRMVSDALRGDRRIGMVLASSAWHADAATGREIHCVGGLGTIREVQELEDGRFDIVLSGVSRFRILEFVSESPYRLARVELLEDPYLAQPEDRGLVEQLIIGFREYLGPETLNAEDGEMLAKVDLVTLTNSVCSAVRIPLQDKQALLEVDEVRIRAETVLMILDQLRSRKRLIGGFDHLRPDDPGRN